MKKFRANKMKVLDYLVKEDLTNYNMVRIEDFVNGEIFLLLTKYDLERLNYDVSQRLVDGIREKMSPNVTKCHQV